MKDHQIKEAKRRKLQCYFKERLVGSKINIVKWRRLASYNFMEASQSGSKMKYWNLAVVL
jgi:hypothetical protein